MLSQPLSQIDRTIPGFEDFALEGTRGIEPGSPARSLLFHALASPNVFRDGAGNDLSAFPTPAEIEAVENYVYGVKPPSLDDLQAQADDRPLAVVVFALEYRTGTRDRPWQARRFLLLTHGTCPDGHDRSHL